MYSVLVSIEYQTVVYRNYYSGDEDRQRTYAVRETMAATTFAIGKIDEFDEAQEDFDAYIERLEHWMTANGINEPVPNEAGELVGPDRRVSVLLTAIGAKAYGILRNVLRPAKPSEKSYTEVKGALQSHFKPKASVISERFRFYQRNQYEGESVRNYVTALKQLTAQCEFGTFLDGALRDKLLCGLRNNAIQKRLLSEMKLTFHQAFQTAQAMELAAQNTAEFTNATSTETQSVHQITGKQDKSTPRKEQDTKPVREPPQRFKTQCHRCGGKHNPQLCRFKTAKCFKCHKIVHVRSMCKTQQPMETKYVDEMESEDSDDYAGIAYLQGNMGLRIKPGGIHAIGKLTHKYMVGVTIAGRPIQMELDTGAVVSVISENWHRTNLQEYPLQDTHEIERLPGTHSPSKGYSLGHSRIQCRGANIASCGDRRESSSTFWAKLVGENQA